MVSTATINIAAYTENGIWRLEGTTSQYTDETDSTGVVLYPAVDFIMYLSRKSHFYIINFLVPCVLIVIVALSSFWLPAVFQIVLADQMPQDSDYTPILGKHYCQFILFRK